MPHIESMIEAQRIMCIQKFLDNSLRSWKCILNHYLNKVGGRLLFYCNFEYSKLPIDLPKYYKECLIAWSLLKNSNPSSLDEIFNQPIWNNRFICIDNKSVFSRKLFSAGLCKVGDLCEFICIKPHITESLLNVLDLFYLKCLYHSLPPEWKKEMSSNVTQAANKTTPFNIFAQEELSSKKIYNLLISKISKPPTAKKKLENQYASETSNLDWETIYTLPFKCALDTKSREFQYKILNQILPLNTFLFKIGKTESPLCAFCLCNEECMSHFFFQCTVIQNFWSSIQQLFGNHIITESDVILGITHQSEDALLNNHLILLSKQYIYNCKLKGVLPSRAVFLT